MSRFGVVVLVGVMAWGGWAKAEGALASLGPVMARAGNTLYVMPADWTRKDKDGVTLLMPPELPQRRWFELRLLPGEESLASPEQAVQQHVAAIKQRYKVLQETPLKSSKHAKGWIAASIALTVNVAGAGAMQPDLRYWVIYAARPNSRIEVLYYVSNDFDVYVRECKTVEKFIAEMNYSNLVVLAEGAPNLTELIVNETTDLLEWLLDVPFTSDQRQRIRDGLVETWKNRNQKEVDATMQLVAMRRQLATMDPAKVEFARAKVQGELIAMMRKDTSEFSKMMVAVYDSGHKPIAQGTPALTRQASDAMLELVYFMASELEGGQAVVPTAEEKSQWATRLAEQYPKMPEQQRNGIVQMPMMWAGMRWAWPTLAAGEKQKLKEQFAQFEPVKQVRQSIAAARKAKDESFAATMQRMQRSHESYMMLSNMSSQMHQANMAAISNIGGGGGWRYEYRYR